MSTATPQSARTTSTRKKSPRPRARRDARALADLVRQAVDDGATSVEEIHQAIAALPLEILERLDGFEDALKNVRRIQKQSIGAVYDVIRSVNAEVTRMAGDLVERARPRRPAKRARKA